MLMIRTYLVRERVIPKIVGSVKYWAWDWTGKVCISLNAAINPLIYSACNAKYRQAFMQTFPFLGFRTRKQVSKRLDRKIDDVTKA